MNTITKIQDAYIAHLLANPNRPYARRSANEVATNHLGWLGFNRKQAKAIIRQAQDMVELHQLAA